MKAFVAQVLDGSMTVAKDAEMIINARLAQSEELADLGFGPLAH